MTSTKPKRILIIRTGGVGDFILSLPVIGSLRDAWPDAHLEILGRPGIAVLAKPLINGITSIDEQRFARLFGGATLEASDPGAAFLSSFDLVFSFLGAPDSDFGRRLRSLVGGVFFIPAPPEGGKHAARHFVECLDSVFAALWASAAPDSGESGHYGIPEIRLQSEDLQEGRRLLERLLGGATPPIIVHPGSGGRRKNWRPELFAQTIRLFRQSHLPVVLLQGEADEAAVREVLRSGDGLPVLKDESLLRVAAAIAASRLVIGNDSGISHLAAAVGTPLVCLFGPTDPVVWRPLGPMVKIITFGEAAPERVYAEGIELINRRQSVPPFA